MRFVQGSARDFRQANASNVAFFDHVSQCAHTVFNRHAFVPAVQVVQVNHIGLQAAQAVFTGLLNRGWPAVNHPHQFSITRHIHTLHAAFAGQCEFVAMRLHHLADQGFVRAKAVQRGGVKQGHSGVKRCQQYPLALLCSDRRAVGVAQVHAAQADGRNIKRAELAGR